MYHGHEKHVIKEHDFNLVKYLVHRNALNGKELKKW
jgi:hypothetical protein